MNKNLLSISLIISLSLLTACGGGSSSNTETEGSTGSGTSGDGSSEDGSTGDGSTAGGSTAGGSTGDGSTGDGSTGDGSTDGGSTNTASSKVIYDKTKTYVLQGNPGSVQIKVTEYHQNNDSTFYNLWDYRFSPSKDSYRIFQDSYRKTVSPPNIAQQDDTFEQNALETNIILDPRVIVPSRDNRKATTMSHYPETQLSGIRFSSIESRQFDVNTSPPTLTGINFKDEPEDLVTNQDPCSSVIVSKGEILFSAIGEGLWQIGDKLTIEIDATSPALSCGGINTIGSIQTSSKSTSILTAYIPVLSIRGSQFHNVLEFTEESSTVASSNVILSRSGKAYLQYYTGGIVTSKKTCIGGAIDSSTAICSEEDIVANNVSAIPEQ